MLGRLRSCKYYLCIKYPQNGSFNLHLSLTKSLIMQHEQFIFVIILGSGLLGGLTNFFISYAVGESKGANAIKFFKATFLSISAAFSVPLFLQILSNNLLDVPDGGVYPVKNYFILGGFCVLAAIFSQRFLDDLYARLQNAEDQNKKQDQELKKIENKMTETPLPIEKLRFDAAKTAFSKEQFKTVISAILDSKYIHRTIDGIVKDIRKEREFDLSESEVVSILELLKGFGIAKNKKSKTGQDLWQIVIPGDFFSDQN